VPIIQTPEIALKLFRRFRLDRPPDSLLSPEVVPVVVVDDLTDYNTSGADRRCMGISVQGAVAAEFAIAVLVNSLPQRLHVTAVTISTPTGQNVAIARPTQAIVGLTAVVHKAFVDFRVPGQPQAVNSVDTVVALPNRRVMWDEPVLASSPVRLPLDVTLFGGEPGAEGPGGAGSRALLVSAGTVNTELRVSWEWTEGVQEG